MRRTVLRMLTGQSLAAFSASVQARARQNVAVDAPGAVRPPSQPYTPAPLPSLRPAPPPPRPPADAVPPRGALLDLSV
jgi:hypothetical protein